MFSLCHWFGSRKEPKKQTINNVSTPPSAIKPLTLAIINQDVTVVRIKLDDKEIARLSELGLRIGSTIRVLHSSPEDALLVAVGDGRIGLNFETAQKIYVY